ncbi:hypothetical protein [Caulobacter sp. 17J65-9]|uniref:hypothetical protein n=1 Tax=Caulobacter sp. 17J65-9 TaxID=2709382 RepID=UPI0013CD4839|nr:hypothetical protein [Caulobacter sp. 17J65-9]NEX93943.1 hypothetical protein [Caulobacter sp. 17J65-9]
MTTEIHPGGAIDIFDEGEVLADELESSRARRWGAQVVVVALVMLLFLNARSLQSWAYTLEPSWRAETIRALADTWAARTKLAGFDDLRAGLRSNYEAARAGPESGQRRPPA